MTTTMPTSLSAVDKLAGDNGVNVAIAIDGDPKKCHERDRQD